MANKVKKYVEDRDEWSTEQHISYMRTGQLPVSEEWEERRREAMEDADLELDDAGPKPADEQTVDEIAKAMQSTKIKVGD